MENWTKWQDAEDVNRVLIANGIKAGIVNDARGAIDDPHLRSRHFWVYLDHPVVGITLYNRAPMVFSKTPIQMKTSAPLLGQHTKEVLSNLLEYTEDEIKQLVSEEVLL